MLSLRHSQRLELKCAEISYLALFWHSLRETTPRTILSARAVSGDARWVLQHKGRTWTCYAYCTRVGVGTPVFSVPSRRLPFLQPLLNPYFSHTEFGLSFSSPLFFTGVDSDG